MAKIALRVYNHEIENLIEGGQVDEAIAHCQHILKTFPMHVDTYRLLGKAYLEVHRYADAADIFLRLLHALPDDFVTHVGMSIIRDDENKLDDAIWHMERAFQVQPSNPAIQSELRRLYGRRDGAEPPKIRLSRDALANMYAQGELYNQAIIEIRSVLADDPSRPDLQAMLARAYFRSGQKVEAAEMAILLLKKYPHCLDALRILLDVLPGTSRADDTQTYRQRLRLLDPYSSFVTGSVFDSGAVADAAVNLERLEYVPTSASAGKKDDWAASLGVKMDQNGGGEKIPEWLGTGSGNGTLPDPVPTAAAASAVPDWLREAGWTEATGDGKGTAPEQSGDGDPALSEPIAHAEIPEWLQSMAPPEVTGGISRETDDEPLLSGDLPDWLEGIKPETAQEPSDAGSGNSTPAEDLPEWLNMMKSDSEDAPVPEPGAPLENPDDSLSSAGPSDKVPDWLREVESEPTGGTDPKTSNTQESTQGVESTPPAPSEDIPQWLNEMSPGVPEEIQSEPVPSSEAVDDPQKVSPASPGDLPDWLNEMKPIAGEESRPDILPPAEPAVEHADGEHPSEDLPDWLQAIKSESAPETLAQPEALANDEKQPDSGSGKTPGSATSQRLSIDDAAMGWLESLAAKQGAKPEELLTRPEDRPTEVPASFTGLGQEAAPSTEPGQPVSPIAAEIQPVTEFSLDEGEIPLPAAAAPLDETPPFGSSGSDETAPPVTEELMTPGLVEPTAAQTEPGDDTLAAWLRDLDTKGEKPENPVDVSPGTAGSEKPGLPDWLKDDHEAGENDDKISASEVPTTELPDWLRSGEESAPVQETQPWELGEHGQDGSIHGEVPPVPTIPGEWVPAEKVLDASDQRAHPTGISGEAILEPAAAPASDTSQPATPPVSTSGDGQTHEKDKESELLDAAQVAIKQNQLGEAIHSYSKLIKKGKLLDEVIHDLREANYRFPVDIIVWQTLGDAYMRANRLQEALDAYTEAEKLLR